MSKTSKSLIRILARNAAIRAKKDDTGCERIRGENFKHCGFVHADGTYTGPNHTGVDFARRVLAIVLNAASTSNKADRRSGIKVARDMRLRRLALDKITGAK